MNQRKIVLFALTLLVSACMYVSFTLSKKLQAVIHRVLTLESHVNTIQDKKTSAPTMNITDSKHPTLTAYVNDESVSDVDYTPSSDDETDIQQVGNALLNGVSNSLEGTNLAISSMNSQLLELHNHIGRSKFAPATEVVSQSDDTNPTATRNVENDNDLTLTSQEVDNLDADDIGSDEEVEYVIEYETVSEDEDEDDRADEEDDDSAVENIEQFACAMSQKHTKNNLISILKEHDLSTYGNKDTLIKRIMTIDNFQQYLSTA